MSDFLKILIVDDEDFNIDIIESYLSQKGFEISKAKDGQEGWEVLEKNPDIEIIILDRMMPRMNGMEFLKKLKSHPTFHTKIVIMQTVANSDKEILEGIEAGVYYYLTKPYEKKILLAIVQSATDEILHSRTLQEELKREKSAFNLIEKASFFFQTLEDVHSLSNLLSNFYPDPHRALTGLKEILLNAVEHGNLGIEYSEKKDLLINGGWIEEIVNRQKKEEYRYKKAKAVLEKKPQEIVLLIQDEGKGFDWSRYMDFDIERLTDPNGRGIALSKKSSFDSVEYLGCGNEVICRVYF